MKPVTFHISVSCHRWAASPKAMRWGWELTVTPFGEKSILHFAEGYPYRTQAEAIDAAREAIKKWQRRGGGGEGQKQKIEPVIK